MLKKLLLLLMLLTMGAIAGVIMGFAIKNRSDDNDFVKESSRLQFAYTMTAASLAIASAVLGILFLLAKMLHIPWIDFLWLTITAIGLWFTGAAVGRWSDRIRNGRNEEDGYDKKMLTEFILLCILSLAMLVPLVLWAIKAMRDYLRRHSENGTGKRSENVA